jgi:hypothetical protein
MQGPEAEKRRPTPKKQLSEAETDFHFVFLKDYSYERKKIPFARNSSD